MRAGMAAGVWTAIIRRVQQGRHGRCAGGGQSLQPAKAPGRSIPVGDTSDFTTPKVLSTCA